MLPRGSILWERIGSGPLDGSCSPGPTCFPWLTPPASQLMTAKMLKPFRGAAIPIKTWACSRQNLTEKVANEMWAEGGGETLPVTP